MAWVDAANEQTIGLLAGARRVSKEPKGPHAVRRLCRHEHSCTSQKTDRAAQIRFGCRSFFEGIAEVEEALEHGLHLNVQD